MSEGLYPICVMFTNPESLVSEVHKKGPILPMDPFRRKKGSLSEPFLLMTKMSCLLVQAWRALATPLCASTAWAHLISKSIVPSPSAKTRPHSEPPHHPHIIPVFDTSAFVGFLTGEGQRNAQRALVLVPFYFCFLSW